MLFVKQNNFIAKQINPLYLNWIISESEHEGDNYFAANIRALRMQIDTSYHYLNPVWLPEDGELKMSKPGHKNIAASENTISISPNPANEYFIINYVIEEEIKQATAEIYDVLGKKINTINITSKTNQQLIKCADYINGQYYCIIKNNNKIVNTIKFNVTH